MFIDQIEVALGAAYGTRALDDISRLIWRGLAEGLLAEADAEAVSTALEARRGAIKANAARTALPRPSAPRRLVSPDRRRSIERRRRLAGSGAMPGRLAAHFTTGEAAALSVVAREVQRRGRCEFALDKIAAIAGVGRTTVQNALRHARRLGLVGVEERRRRGRCSLTNVVAVISGEWRAWLRLSGHRVQKSEHHEIPDRFGACGQGAAQTGVPVLFRVDLGMDRKHRHARRRTT